MKKFIIISLLLFASTCFAEDKKEPVVQINPIEVIQVSCADTGLNVFQKEELGRRGCCSHHSGVCGCSAGRVVCCDDTYSPSCTCKTEDQPVEVK